MKDGSQAKMASMKRSDYKQPDYWIKHVDLTFDIRDGETFVNARMHIERNGTHNKPLVLSGEEMELQKIKLNGVPLDEANGDYKTDDQSLTLSGGLTEDKFLLETTVKIEPEKNTALEGLYKSEGTYCTQCEAEGFRRITYFMDRPDNMATYTTTIIGDPGKVPVLLSNGNLVDQGTWVDGRHYTKWEDPFPKPSYLFALVGGKLDHIEDKFTTSSGRDVTLRIYSEPKDSNKLLHAMEALKHSMKWDEEKFGREYDLDLFNIVAVDYFNMGAMENKSLNIFNTSAVLAHPETQTDHDYQWVEGVVAHEYFHNWTGNRITCRDWFQLTLKEGLTVFRDQEFSADMGSRAVNRIENVQTLRAGQFAEDAGPTAHPIRPDQVGTINNFYSRTVYNKGAEVIRMQQTLLGEKGFRKATDLYFARHDGQAVTCEDFVKCMEDASGKDLSQFRLWYSQAGTPEVTAKWDHDKTTGKFTLTLQQKVPNTPDQKTPKKPMHIPVKFGIVGADGKDVVLDAATGATDQVLELTKGKQTFTFDNIPEGAVPSILRNFSAPVKLDADYSDSDLLHLMQHDSDGFNQWEAGQRFVMKKILEQVNRKEQGQAVVFDDTITDAFRTILARKDIDPALKELALGLPSYGDIAAARSVVDPQAITDVRKALKQKLGSELKQQWMQAYKDNMIPASKPYSPDVADIGKRALKNLTLSYLMSSGDSNAASLAAQQYALSKNMTDRINAFGAVIGSNDIAEPDRQAIVDDFYDIYEKEPLAINKWFSAQAGNQSDDVLDTVKALSQHKAFDALNPNKARALYGAFSGNPKGFHAADGSGYKFVADFIMKTDAKNPQLAARLIGAFADYKRYKPELRDQMKTELERMAAMPKLSPDLRENLDKFLDSGAKAPKKRGPSPE